MEPLPSDAPIGIIGAGAMGSGIALVALSAGHPVILHDSYPAALDNARAYLEKFLLRKGLAHRLDRLTLVAEFSALAPARLVIEAAIEDLSIKQDLFARLDALLPPPALLATNTSTLSVTAIAAAARRPERVAGMHFFNPAPVLPLVEIVRAAQTSPETVGTLQALAAAWGKTPVLTPDTPGFIVNRVARPFYGEALRLLGERAAAHTQIDLLAELGADFRMGPFRLMDLIGIDINAAAMRSMYDQTFGEPRYRPHWIQGQMTAQGSLGRKTGRGFYDYGPDAPQAEPPAAPALTPAAGVVWLAPGAMGPGMADLIAKGGWTVIVDPAPDRTPALGLILAGRGPALREAVLRLEADLPPAAPLICQTADITLAEVQSWIPASTRLAGFDGLFCAAGGAVALTGGPRLAERARAAADEFFRALGRLPVWVDDSPGLILPRIVCMLANEAAFAVQDGVADPETIDAAMRLGVNYPRGPLAWGRLLGWPQVLAVLENLFGEYGEERYRPCRLIRRWARGG